MLEKFKALVSEKLKNAGPEPPRLTMRVCMLGARGVGKTSVITSLFNSQKDAVAGTKLFLVANGDTQVILNNKKNLLDGLFTGLHGRGDLLTEGGLPGDAGESLFEFTYGMSTERINIDLEIRDYPGEYLRSDPDIVASYVREADAVIIAIDTPCLMEAEGRYHAGKNRPELVTSFLRDHLSPDGEKLVLFVPLKCEKYFSEGRIDDVTRRVEEAYADLIDYLKTLRNVETNKRNVCCVVAPIQTLGSVVFHSFQAGPDGAVEEISTADGLPLPAKINYCYASANAKYAPKFCEQPLFYLLGFVSMQYRQAREQKDSGGILSRIREALRLIPHIDEFMLEISNLSLKRLNGAHGYKILFGRGRIGG